jgi:hypothetical protein
LYTSLQIYQSSSFSSSLSLLYVLIAEKFLIFSFIPQSFIFNFLPASACLDPWLNHNVLGHLCASLI